MINDTILSWIKSYTHYLPQHFLSVVPFKFVFNGETREWERERETVNLKISLSNWINFLNIIKFKLDALHIYSRACDWAAIFFNTQEPISRLHQETTRKKKNYMYIQPRKNSKSRWLSSQFTVCRLRAKCLFTSVTWEVEDCLMLSLLSVCEKSWSCDLIFHANTRLDVTVIQPRRGCQYACNQWIQLDLSRNKSKLYISKFVYSEEIVMWDDRQFVWETDQCLIDDNIMNHFFSLSFMFLRFSFFKTRSKYML